MPQPKFALGIDLGTSNCALAVCDLSSDDLRMVDIAQTTAPNKIEERDTLPSALYLAHENEFPGESLALPWSDHDQTEKRHHRKIRPGSRSTRSGPLGSVRKVLAFQHTGRSQVGGLAFHGGPA